MTKINEKLDGCELQLRNQVDEIIQAIENCEYNFDKEYSEYDEPCASDYLSDFLDVNYVINADKSYKGCRILVAFGGPNIWIDTVNKEVQGYWANDKYIQPYFNDGLGVCDYFEEAYITEVY